VDKIFETLSTCASLHPPTMPADGGYSAFGGLDADSMVYADADGNLVGGGVEQMTAEEEADELSSAGRVRSDFVGGPRHAPY
jgi:nucleotide-sensitive chloride channel 1A